MLASCCICTIRSYPWEVKGHSSSLLFSFSSISPRRYRFGIRMIPTPDFMCRSQNAVLPRRKAVARQIGGSVGIKGANAADEVTTVQDLLNRAPTGLGGPLAAIAVDGIFGSETLGAISRFQGRNFGWVDGRVDPNGQTLAKLNAYADLGGAAPPVGPKPAGGSKFAPSSSSSTGGAPSVGGTVDNFAQMPTWAFLSSTTGKVKMKFPSSWWLTAFGGFLLPSGSCVMTYDATGAPLDLDLTPHEMNEPYPWQPGSASLIMQDGRKISIGPYSLWRVP
jgi:hypothetical protein